MERSMGLSSCKIVRAAQAPICKAWNLSEISYGSPVLSSTPSAPYSVNITDDALRKVVIDDQVHAFKIDSSAHQVRANEHPGHALPKIAHDFVTFSLGPIGVYHVHVHALIQQFLESANEVIHGYKRSRRGRLQLLSALFRLDEY